ncbi:RNA polymerase B [Peltigera leucophlebia]|nr:RNA polymerase B [Peltigera leucophlebia]
MASALSLTSRQREKPIGDEEAGIELKLGEFQTVPTLTLSEARVLINAVMDHRKQQGRKVMETESDGFPHRKTKSIEFDAQSISLSCRTLIKTQDYLDVFARFKQKENIEAVERMLTSKTELELFERSQLGSLCCESAEEAKTLIPSLANKISDPDLQELLDDITKLRNFVE